MSGRLWIAAAVVAIVVVAWLWLRAPSKPMDTSSPVSSAASSALSAPRVQSAEPSEVVSVDLVPPDAAPVGEGVRVELPWGPDGLGKGTSEDGYPGGPNSFVTGADGSTWILDQFNHRLVKVGPDGKIVETRALKVTSPADLAIQKDGSMVVVDRTRDHRVELFDAQGRSRGSLPLPDAVPGQPSDLQRVFVNKEQVYGQRGEGGPLIALGGMDGRAAPENTEINGQFSRDGKLLLSAGITNFDVGRVWVGGADPQSGANLFTRELNLDNALEQILLFDSDNSGMIYLVLKAIFDDEGTMSTVLVLCLDGNARAKLAKIFSLPYPEEPLDTFRKFDVAPEGGLLAAEYTDRGVAYRAHSCR